MPLPNNIPIPFPIVFKQVPNYEKGRGGHVPDMIVIHIADGTRDSVYNTFMTTQKSSHFLVNQDGSIWQFVGSGDTAWGNGIVVNPVSELVLARVGVNPNSYSISIEHEGFGTADINAVQYSTTIQLVSYLCKKWNIPVDRTHIIRHQEIEAVKTCPGLVSVEKIIEQVRLTS